MWGILPRLIFLRYNLARPSPSQSGLADTKGNAGAILAADGLKLGPYLVGVVQPPVFLDTHRRLSHAFAAVPTKC